ncbi:MAG: zinc-binding dehydrogenase [Chloroflexi bacterium]|nr:zinc-binding dehydrogenase [Chloroflexota bacterium]MBV9894912.1 zinc-binding dehydrogenase [Chloroflexota bacterium]
MKTRAAVHVEFQKPLVVEEIELPEPGPTQLLIKQFASGICHSQLHSLHNPKTLTPRLMGHESTGVVVEAGADVTHVKEGDHVMVTFLPRSTQPGARLPIPVLKWRDQEIQSHGNNSTWSEMIVADASFVVPLDKSAPTDVTAVIGCAVMTGCGAVINTARVQVGDSVVVIGVGGVGLASVQAAANVNAYPIIAVDVDDSKLEYARRFGATHGINSRTQDAVARVLEITGHGVDFAFDAIGRQSTIDTLLKYVRPGVAGYRPEGGTAVLIGVPRPEATLNVMDALLPGSKTFKGTNGGSPRPDHDLPMYVRWFQEGKLPLDLLVSRRYRLDQINDGIGALERGEILGRAIIEF